MSKKDKKNTAGKPLPPKDEWRWCSESKMRVHPRFDLPDVVGIISPPKGGYPEVKKRFGWMGGSSDGRYDDENYEGSD